MVKAKLAKNNNKFQFDDSPGEQGTFTSWVLRHMADKDRNNPVMLATQQMVRKYLLSCHHAYQLRVL